MPGTILETPPHVVPVVFTRAMLDWLPWLKPLAEGELTQRHMTALVDAARAKSAYFRLLARDPDALEARTRTDKDIFYNQDAGLPRAERELAAAATSRFNGCIYCASVHSRVRRDLFKARGRRPASARRRGRRRSRRRRWNAIVAAAVALSATPIAFGPQHDVERLRQAGLDDLSISDVIHAAAFFNWANRLMRCRSASRPRRPDKRTGGERAFGSSYVTCGFTTRIKHSIDLEEVRSRSRLP